MMTNKEFIARRVARELKDGDVVNLGIGLPTLVADYVDPALSILLQSENGFTGLGPTPEAGAENPDITNAGGKPVTVLAGGAFFDSADSFAMIRGGHVNVTVIGALQVDARGAVASWVVPGKAVPGMGGAMDLLVGARRVIIAMEHTVKGAPKILERCTYPLTATGGVDRIVTEMCVMDVDADGLVLRELNPQYTVEDVRAATAAAFRLADIVEAMRA